MSTKPVDFSAIQPFVKEVCERYAREETTREIAAGMHSYKQKVLRALQYAGVERRKVGRIPKHPSERFWKFVDKRCDEECWLWKGGRTPDGYGIFTVGKVHHPRGTQSAQRVAFWLTHGHWPNVARHTCDNPPCCNPAHILDGTHLDNARDKYERHRVRHARGSRMPQAKFTQEDADEIRTLAGLATGAELARAYGVSTSAMCKLIRGESWRST